MENVIYDENEQPYVMYDRLVSLIAKAKQQKKEKILKLFNKIFKENNKSLRFFKKIDIYYFSNNKHIQQIIEILENHEKSLNIKMDKIKKYKSINFGEDDNSDSSESVSDSEESVSSREYKKPTKINKKNVITKTAPGRSKSINNVKEEKDIDINKEIFLVLNSLLKGVDFKLQKITESGKVFYNIIISS